MSSTFFGLTIAGSGLSAYQTALNVTANNISNADTDGYTRQTTTRVTGEPLRVHERYGQAGSGVVTTAITQLRDEFYDLRYWNNNGGVGEYEQKNYYMSQIDTFFNDTDQIKGYSSILTEMFNSLETLKNNPSDLNFRNQFINYTQSLCEYFNSTAITLEKMQEDANSVMYTKVQRVNAIAKEIACLNKQINIVEQQSPSKANELRDNRALLVDELSLFLPVEVSEEEVANSNYPEDKTGATYYTIKVNGHNLVNNYNYDTIDCIPRKDKINQSDVEGLYDFKWNSDESNIGFASNALTGELKGLYDIINGNNSANFKGIITAIETNEGKDANGDQYFYSTVTVSDTNMAEEKDMTLYPEGTITLGLKEYKYTGYVVNDDGSFTFTLTEKATDTAKLINSKAAATVGKSVDYMGIPFYQQQMNEFVRCLAKLFNDIHTKGIDLNGDEAGIFLTGKDLITGADLTLSDEDVTSTSDSYNQLTARNLKVSDVITKDPSKLATSSDPTLGVEYKDILEEMAKLYDKVDITASGSAKNFLTNMLSDIAIEAQKARLFSENYTNVSKVIENKRLSVSNVDLDEEGIEMVKFQNAYNLCSRMIQTMSECYDRLITQTGV
ncbi:flagellar hook-associated protein 1 FlgK [Acetitomaculum ruminis DSM 5522]|uniref:Flagellar hook-associated protein 1 n=1 Tax=Acetitomaculum ruminis DSM 5522 TaxID=1120918 RepID=A0A1I0WJQ1_9FIRM|nr:flagellar hook-associated protein FlgK [Acetitomaculum ruminis]SFA88784.1 flagellar hook-associated protein 1 FlgK [Acetitomaculum ruminis DSM 5522]